MSAACGQSGNHPAHMYQNGAWPNGNPKMVACNGKDNG